MMPSKVISISEARRRLPGKGKAKAKAQKPQRTVWPRVSAWLSGRTTNGMVLLVGVVVGLVVGTLVASVRQANLAVAGPVSPAAVEQPGPEDLVDYEMP